MANRVNVRFALALVAINAALASAEAQQHNVSTVAPIVVELFTSQGCDSCLAVSNMIDEITRRPDVIVLSFHVDYWDYIGWRDSLAIPAAKTRQRAYSRSLGTRLLRTPQIVVDGAIDTSVYTLAETNSTINVLETRTAKVPIQFVREDAGISILIPAGVPDVSAVIWLALFDREVVTNITAGDNAGRSMRSVNVVRRLEQLGKWQGDSLKIRLDVDDAIGYDGCAVFVQTDPIGPILGAAALQFDRMEGQ